MPSPSPRAACAAARRGYSSGMTAPDDPAAVPHDDRADPPPPASVWVEDHEPPTTEAEREATETVRAISRLEESN